MLVFRQLLIRAAKQIAADPRVQAKAAEIIQTEIKPRAQSAWRNTKPKLASAKAELQEIAREIDPRDDPKAFAAKVKQRFLKPERRD